MSDTIILFNNIFGACRLKVTKTGRNQHVTITDFTICSVLRLYIDLLPRITSSGVTSSESCSLFNLSSSQYRRLFHLACLNLGFESIGYTPHSLRHGGVTYDAMRGVPVADLCLRGRWRSDSALTIYVQQAQVLL